MVSSKSSLLPPTERVNAVARALSLLDAFGIQDASLGLAELGRRTGLPKPTVLRIARTLAESGYMVALDGGAWRLGPSTARLGARYRRAFDMTSAIEPVLQDLAADSGLTASFFAPEGEQRIRLLRIRGESGFVSPTQVGEALPLDRGAAGLVMLAASGRTGPLYDAIREKGFHSTVGEADAVAASVAAPVFGRRGALVGALALALRSEDAMPSELERLGPLVQRAAQRLSRQLATAQGPLESPEKIRSYWHP